MNLFPLPATGQILPGLSGKAPSRTGSTRALSLRPGRASWAGCRGQHGWRPPDHPEPHPCPSASYTAAWRSTQGRARSRAAVTQSLTHQLAPKPCCWGLTQPPCCSVPRVLILYEFCVCIYSLFSWWCLIFHSVISLYATCRQMMSGGGRRKNVWKLPRCILLCIKSQFAL